MKNYKKIIDAKEKKNKTLFNNFFQFIFFQTKLSSENCKFKTEKNKKT